VTRAAEAITVSRRRRTTTLAAMSAAGQILIHVPTASRTVATAGRPASHSSPATANGTVTASIRYIPIGPSSSAYASQNQAAETRARERARPMSRAKATAFSAVTRIDHAMM
jgi:hypothetical protein